MLGALRVDSQGTNRFQLGLIPEAELKQAPLWSKERYLCDLAILETAYAVTVEISQLGPAQFLACNSEALLVAANNETGHCTSVGESPSRDATGRVLACFRFGRARGSKDSHPLTLAYTSFFA